MRRARGCLSRMPEGGLLAKISPAARSDDGREAFAQDVRVRRRPASRRGGPAGRARPDLRPRDLHGGRQPVVGHCRCRRVRMGENGLLSRFDERSPTADGSNRPRCSSSRASSSQMGGASRRRRERSDTSLTPSDGLSLSKAGDEPGPTTGTMRRARAALACRSCLRPARVKCLTLRAAPQAKVSPGVLPACLDDLHLFSPNKDRPTTGLRSLALYPSCRLPLPDVEVWLTTPHADPRST